jgi:hypothetical protein
VRAAALALCIGLLTGTAAGANTVGGRYRVEGINPNGTHYHGTATITPSSNTTCRIAWQVGSNSVGICMLAGKVLGASYVLGGKVGLVLYQVEADGSLKGIWTLADQPGAGRETLTPAR